MSAYTWKTEMRASGYGVDNPEAAQLKAAREADKLAGQAGATVLDDGRVELIAMPDRNCLPTTVTISTADAWALVRALAATLPPEQAGQVEARAWPPHPRRTARLGYWLGAREGENPS